jgi:hypothetical protein
VQKHGNLWKGQTPFVKKRKVYGHIMRLDDVWLQTTLNTPNISGIWQIKKWFLVSLKAHQPRQGQSPLAGCFCFFVCLKHRQ